MKFILLTVAEMTTKANTIHFIVADSFYSAKEMRCLHTSWPGLLPFITLLLVPLRISETIDGIRY